jgi:cell division protein FtsA
MDTRIGYPNEHLAGDSDEEFSSHYIYSSRVSDEQHRNKTQAVRMDEIALPKAAVIALLLLKVMMKEEEEEEVETRTKANNEESTGDKIKNHLIVMLTRLKIF